MQNGVDVRAPFWISPLRLIIVLGVCVAIFVTRLVIARLLQRQALARQRQAAERAARKDPALIDAAIAQLHSVYAAYERQELSAAMAVEQASAIVRELFDATMNHQTRYQARYEIANRQLTQLAELIAEAYPVQFVATVHQVSPAAVQHIFAVAEGVVNTCR